MCRIIFAPITNIGSDDLRVSSDRGQDLDDAGIGLQIKKFKCFNWMAPGIAGDVFGAALIAGDKTLECHCSRLRLLMVIST